MVQRIREMDPSQRPRERLLDRGPAALSDAELIAVLLRTGRPGRGAVATAHELLAEAGGLGGVARLEMAELMTRPGVGPAKAAALLAALELGDRLARSRVRRGVRLDQPEAAADFLTRRLQRERREVFGFLSLDSRHRLLRCRELTQGTRTQAPVDPAELLRQALVDDAAGLLLYHNHPSGELAPSRDDCALTRRLAQGAELVGLHVLDHLLLAEGRWLSLRQSRPDLFV